MLRPSIAFVTPTHAKDLDRFRLLRHSLAIFCPHIPHYAFVDTEDLPLFRDLRRNDPAKARLELIATADLLPAEIERERRFWRSLRGRITERLGWRVGLFRRFSGWKLQQLIKIEALANLSEDVGVFLDSDIFLCGPVDPDTFVTDEGAVRLLETPAETYWDLGFEVGRQIVLGRPLAEKADAFNYIHQAPRFLRRTGRRLLEELGRHGPSWRHRLFREPFLSEYDLLGWTARVAENYASYVREPGPPERWTYNALSKDDIDPCLEACRRERGSRKFFLIQSTTGVPVAAYRDRVLALLAELSRDGGSSAASAPSDRSLQSARP